MKGGGKDEAPSTHNLTTGLETKSKGGDSKGTPADSKGGGASESGSDAGTAASLVHLAGTQSLTSSKEETARAGPTQEEMGTSGAEGAALEPVRRRKKELRAAEGRREEDSALPVDEEPSYLEELEGEAEEAGPGSSLGSHLDSSRYGSQITQRGVEGTRLAAEVRARRRTGIRRPPSLHPRHALLIGGPLLFLVLKGLAVYLDTVRPLSEVSIARDPAVDAACAWSEWVSVNGRDCLCDDWLRRESAKCGVEVIPCATVECPWELAEILEKDAWSGAPACLCFRDDACKAVGGWEAADAADRAPEEAYFYVDQHGLALNKSVNCPSLHLPEHDNTPLIAIPCAHRDRISGNLICRD